MINLKKHNRVSVVSSNDDELDDRPLFTRIPSMRVLSRPELPRSKIKVEEEEKPELPFIIANLFATALEDAATQLRILAECNNELRIMKTLSDMDSLVLKKFDVVHDEEIDELEGVDHTNIHTDKFKLDKLAADRKICADTIISTYLDLAMRKDFETIIKTNTTLKERDSYYENLLENEAKNKVTKRDLYKQLRQQRNYQKTAMYETNVEIENIRNQLEDALLLANIRERYVVNWQVARTEQNTQSIEDKEVGSSQNISYFRKRLEHESRVHTEVELLTSIRITDTLQQVEEWMDKYDADIEDVDLKIQIKKNDYKSQADIREEMEKRLEQHDQLMKDWVKFKKEREERRQYQIKMTNAAIVTQAWWRGILVRLFLGPYKKKKKPKGKKK